MFDWMTNDQLDFVSDAASKHAEAWVEKKYPNASNKEKKQNLRDASKWFSFWAEQLSKKESVIKDQEKYLDAMRNNDCTDNLFHRNGPLEAEPCAREVKEE